MVRIFNRGGKKRAMTLVYIFTRGEQQEENHASKERCKENNLLDVAHI